MVTYDLDLALYDLDKCSVYRLLVLFALFSSVLKVLYICVRSQSLVVLLLVQATATPHITSSTPS